MSLKNVSLHNLQNIFILLTPLPIVFTGFNPNLIISLVHSTLKKKEMKRGKGKFVRL